MIGIGVRWKKYLLFANDLGEEAVIFPSDPNPDHPTISKMEVLIFSS